MTVKEIENKFKKEGWSNPHFRELSKKEAEEKGYLFALWSKNQYFVMIGNGNVYDSNGNIAHFNI